MAAPRGRDSPEAAGAERGSRTLGSRRDSAPGGGGVGEGWGGRPGTDKGARKRALRLRAARRPASRRGLRMRRAAGAGGRSAPARKEEGREGGMWGARAPCPRLTQRRRLGGRRVRGEGLAESRGAGVLGVGERCVCGASRGSDGTRCASGAAVEELLLSVLSHAGLGRCSAGGCKAGAAVCWLSEGPS